MEKYTAVIVWTASRADESSEKRNWNVTVMLFDDQNYVRCDGMYDMTFKCTCKEVVDMVQEKMVVVDCSPCYTPHYWGKGLQRIQTDQ